MFEVLYLASVLSLISNSPPQTSSSVVFIGDKMATLGLPYRTFNKHLSLSLRDEFLISSSIISPDMPFNDFKIISNISRAYSVSDLFVA